MVQEKEQEQTKEEEDVQLQEVKEEEGKKYGSKRLFKRT